MAIDKKLIDQLLTDYKKPEDIIGENGLLKQLTKAVLERALGAEMTEHLGADAHRRSSRQPHRGATALESRRQRAAHQRNPSLREDGACAYADLPHIATLIADGEILARRAQRCTTYAYFEGKGRVALTGSVPSRADFRSSANCERDRQSLRQSRTREAVSVSDGSASVSRDGL